MENVANQMGTSQPHGERLLLVADAGVAAGLVESTLAARGYEVERASPDDPDLFSHAIGHAAIVALPARNLLSAHLADARGNARLDEVLRASAAPGVQVLVVALPAAAHCDAAVETIARHGKPYVVVRAPGLIEEVAETLRDGKGTLWLPRSGNVRASRGAVLAEALASALTTEEQGRSTELPSEAFDVATLFATASHLVSDVPIRVRPVMPLVYRTVRPVARWLKGSEPPLLELADRLLALPAAPARAGALAS
jgi:hypothetical protein